MDNSTLGPALAILRRIPGSAAQRAEAAAEAAEDVLESIPESYSELSADVVDLKNAFDSITTEEEFDFSAVTQSNFTITTANKWSNPGSTSVGRSYSIPISDDIPCVRVKANETIAIIAWLNTYNPVAYQSVDFSTGYNSRITLEAGTEAEYFPDHDTMNYLYVTLVSTSGNASDVDVFIRHITTDSTLTEEKIPADAKATGDAIADVAADVLTNAGDITSIKSDAMMLRTGYSATIDNSTDYDTLTTPGNYRVTTTGNAQTMTHCPVSIPHRLTVITTTASGRIYQILLANNSNYPALFMRFYNGTSWSEWGRFLNTIHPSPVKSYILTEADKVAEKVRNVQTGKSLTFIAISDLHYNIDDLTVQAALQDMRDGINAIAEQTSIDFYASFGDIIYRTSGATDFDKGRQEIIAATKLINDCFGNNQQIRMVGNHDPNSETANDYFKAEYVNAFTGLYSNMLQRNEEVPYGAYGIHDFERQKIRMIVLNTSMYGKNSRPTANGTTYKLGPSQAKWFASALDIHDKTDYADWQIMIFSHVPLDWCRSASSGPINSGALSQYTGILNAYETGGTWGSGSSAVDYAGKNAAKLTLYINGHQHAYKVKNIDYWSGYDDPAPVLERSLKIADLYIPQALPDRYEESMDGQEYRKTANTAQSTAFEVITIDPETNTLYAHHYGAGIDIILHYVASSTSSLSTDLTSPSWSSNDTSIATVSSGTVTPVSSGYTMIWAKSTTDNCIECWNYKSVV